MGKIGNVYAIACTVAIVYIWAGGDIGYIPTPIYSYWNGSGWTRTNSQIQGLLGDLMMWQYRPTIDVEKIKYNRKDSINYDNRFYDDSLDILLGGQKERLG